MTSNDAFHTFYYVLHICLSFQHMSSRRHRDRATGKPPTTNFSPYINNSAHSVLTVNKSRVILLFIYISSSRNYVLQRREYIRYIISSYCVKGLQICVSYHRVCVFQIQTKLTPQKELSRTLTSNFLTSALTPATLCAMATGPLSLSHVHPPTAIVHAPLFNPTLFRPALRPLRTAHGPIVFSPYWKRRNVSDVSQEAAQEENYTATTITGYAADIQYLLLI